MNPGQNIEFKARCTDHESLRTLALEIGAELEGVMVQVDTYYRTSNGRLKIRTIRGSHSELIVYDRADQANPRESRYTVKKLNFPLLYHLVFGITRGRLARVVKERELWWWRGVRIHLDTVGGLGTYLELEAVVDKIGSIKEADKRCRELMVHLKVSKSQLEKSSYGDMVHK
jgi:predicted adenylyl cyclase CyaB